MGLYAFGSQWRSKGARSLSTVGFGAFGVMMGTGRYSQVNSQWLPPSFAKWQKCFLSAEGPLQIPKRSRLLFGWANGSPSPFLHFSVPPPLPKHILHLPESLPEP